MKTKITMENNDKLVTVIEYLNARMEVILVYKRL